jgi:hypothetical protein
MVCPPTTSEAGARWPRIGFVVVATTSRRDNKVQMIRPLELVLAEKVTLFAFKALSFPYLCDPNNAGVEEQLTYSEDNGSQQLLDFAASASEEDDDSGLKNFATDAWTNFVNARETQFVGSEENIL